MARHFTPLFIFAGVMHPLAWIAIRALVGKNITQIDLDQGLRTAQSPALLGMGLGLMAVGAALVFANWSSILSVTKGSAGAAAASLLALMGLALVYASPQTARRGQAAVSRRPAAAGSPQLRLGRGGCFSGLLGFVSALSPGGRWLWSSRLLRFPSPPAGGRWDYNADARDFSSTGKTERRFQQAQDIYKESTMGGEFPGEVL